MAKNEPILTAKDKVAAIKKLLQQGSRGNEWAEAGLLNAIEKVINEEVKDVSSQTIFKLIEEAKGY